MARAAVSAASGWPAWPPNTGRLDSGWKKTRASMFCAAKAGRASLTQPADGGMPDADDLEPLFATLLEQVRARTGVGCVVNTSFNVKGQPLIMDPATAVDTFSRIALDRLYIEGFVVEGTPS